MSCRCGGVYGHGVQDGSELQVQIPETLCSREVCVSSFPFLLFPSHFTISSLSCRSMNTFLIIYLGILLFEAILSTILKYAWQAENKWDEPFYNQKTDQERNSSQVTIKSLHSVILHLKVILLTPGGSLMASKLVGFIKTAGDFLFADFEVYF